MSCAGSSAEHPLVASVIPLVPAWRVDRTFDYLVPPNLAERVTTGTLVRVPFGSRRVRGIVTGVAATGAAPGRRLEEIAAAVIDVPIAPAPMPEVLEWMAERYATPRGRVFGRVVPPRVRVRAASPTGDPPVAVALKLLPSYRGGDHLAAAVRAGGGPPWVVRTLPGEDRGRLIAELAGTAISGGGQALIAVPEVRYGSEVLESLERTFPDLVRVDSSVGDARRSAGWIAAARGAPVVGGGRGAVLAPCPDLRLVVIDDEHHITYKEDRSPRFDARRVALERARLQGATCVFVSSSPSVVTGAKASAGVFGTVEPERAAERGLRPTIEFVDVPRDRAVSHDLHERIRDTLRAGERVALLSPSAGYARALWCSECRRSLRCPRCEAGMIYGRSRREVRCPRCGLGRNAPDSCPYCGSIEFHFVGAGSERLAEQLARSFPRARVVRIDPEVLEKGTEADVSRLRDNVDVYVTTWIGTKPSIRPDVSLVGVLNADALIRRPDFHAAEDGYVALAEMAEWAGPASSGGRLVVQTDEPSHHSLQAIARADYRFFLERELEHRRELSYPPFAELIVARAWGPERAELIEAVVAAARAEGARALGPIEAGRQLESRLELLIKCEDAQPVSARVRDILASVPAGSRLRVDVDPR